MTGRTIYMYILDTLSDWEPVYVLSELNSARGFKKGAERYAVKTFAINNDPVVTMGGLTLLPDLTVEDIKAEDTALLLLPGADTWLDRRHKPVIEKVKAFLDEHILVAAICGATDALANAGLLNNRKHTGNGLEILKKYPAYKGEHLYKDEPAVTDGNLITAPGVAALEFAYEVIKKLDVFTPPVLENWYCYYKTQDPKYIATLMQELSGVNS
jgi:putative intracellular protease/amidase